MEEDSIVFGYELIDQKNVVVIEWMLDKPGQISTRAMKNKEDFK